MQAGNKKTGGVGYGGACLTFYDDDAALDMRMGSGVLFQLGRSEANVIHIIQSTTREAPSTSANYYLDLGDRISGQGFPPLLRLSILAWRGAAQFIIIMRWVHCSWSSKDTDSVHWRAVCLNYSPSNLSIYLYQYSSIAPHQPFFYLIDPSKLFLGIGMAERGKSGCTILGTPGSCSVFRLQTTNSIDQKCDRHHPRHYQHHDHKQPCSTIRLIRIQFNPT